MSLPEFGTPEYAAAEHRIHRRIMDAVSGIAVRKKDLLPPRVNVLIYDEPSGERFFSRVDVLYLGEDGIAHITERGIGIVGSETNPLAIADWTLENNPGVPLVCDETIASEIAQGSITWLGGGHYRLEGRPHGVLEVHTAYDSRILPQGILPKGIASMQIFTE